MQNSWPNSSPTLSVRPAARSMTTVFRTLPSGPGQRLPDFFKRSFALSGLCHSLFPPTACAAARLLPQSDAGALLARGIYIDFPAELRLRPDGETLTPYPPLIGQWFILGHGKRPQSEPKSATQ